MADQIHDCCPTCGRPVEPIERVVKLLRDAVEQKSSPVITPETAALILAELDRSAG